MDYAEEKVDIERTVYDWAIPEFREFFQELSQEKKVARTDRRRGKEKRVGNSNMALVSDTFIRGQYVHRSSIWQLELRRNGAYLCAGLSCLKCFHENVQEIWTRFDIDVANFNGEICHSQGSGVHFCSQNITKFIPLSRIGNKAEAKANATCSFWETDVISISDLSENWDKLVQMDILMLRLRLYIYTEKPFDEASHIAEFQEPVQLRYTDNCPDPHAPSTPLTIALRNLWASREESDVTFNADGEKEHCHKFVISHQSPVLKSMIKEQNEQSPIEIDAISSKFFRQVLKYMYTHDASDIKESTDTSLIAGVLDACNRFKIPSLARICSVRLLTNMTIENFAETAFTIYSKVNQEQSFFKTEVKKFLMENQKELCKSTAFQTKSREQVDLFLQLCFEQLPISRNINPQEL